MTESDASNIVKQCDTIMDPDLLSAGEHFLQTTFQERAEALVQEGLLTEEEMELYIAENNRILTTLVAPAYIALADAVFLLSGSGTHEGGLCELPSGGAYYLYLLRRNTGTSRTPEEIQVLLSDRFQLCYQNLQALVETYREQTGNTSIDVYKRQPFALYGRPHKGRHAFFRFILQTLLLFHKFLLHPGHIWQPGLLRIRIHQRCRSFRYGIPVWALFRKALHTQRRQGRR